MKAVGIVVSVRSYMYGLEFRLTLTNAVILGNFLNPSLFLHFFCSTMGVVTVPTK